MRVLLAASALVAASACCLDVVPDDACVVDRLVARPYCYELVHDEYVCWDGDGEGTPPVRSAAECAGTFHRGDDCSDLGYTLRCGRYWIRPGDRC